MRQLACDLADQLSVQDLFLVGLALDITGAGLLVRSVLDSPAEIWRMGGSYWGYSGAAVVERARDRVDGLFGVLSLCGGFAIQALGSALVLGGVNAGPNGAREVVAGAALALLAVAVVVGLYLALRRRMTDRLIARIALESAEGGWTREKGDRLANLAEFAGYAVPVDYEPRRRFLERTFRIELPDNVEEAE